MSTITIPDNSGELDFSEFLKHYGISEDQFDDMLVHYDLDEADFDKILAHYGIKGMRWGVRKRDKRSVDVHTPVEVRVRPGKRVETRGGTGHTPHEDAVTTAASRQKARQSTVDALSTPELKKLVERMNLEAQYAKLTVEQPTRMDKGKKFVAGLLKDEGMAMLKGKKGPIFGTVDVLVSNSKGRDPNYKGRHRPK